MLSIGKIIGNPWLGQAASRIRPTGLMGAVAGLLVGCQAPPSPSLSSSSMPAGSPPVQPLTRITQSGGGIAIAPDRLAVSTGQVILVPAYSHVYYGDRQDEFLLSVTLSIRNTSLTESIVVRSVRYYDSQGKLIKQYASSALKLPPLASTEFFIPQTDRSGGSSASFVVEWVAEQKQVTAPIVEAIMLSTSFQQGVSFTSSGRVIQELSAPPAARSPNSQ